MELGLAGRMVVEWHLLLELEAVLVEVLAIEVGYVHVEVAEAGHIFLGLRGILEIQSVIHHSIVCCLIFEQLIYN